MADNRDIINHIRVFCADVVQKANSGHPGAPMGMAPMAFALWSQVLNFSPEDPKWPNRDRFILSNGHGCALLYTMLHITGYKDFDMQQIQDFRQWGSKTAGHPEAHFPGIEVTTGPLGQGIANAVGLAIAQEHFAAHYNSDVFPLFDNHTFVFCGDGCLQEGVSGEAASLAGHLGLGRLIVLYDDNQISIDGSTELSFSEDVGKRHEAYGWQVLTVSDGDNNVEAILEAINQAKQCRDKPTLIKVKTVIGFGSKKEGTSGVHGSPLGDEDIANVKKKFGLDPEAKFNLPENVRAPFEARAKEGNQKSKEWRELFEKYCVAVPDKAGELKRRLAGELPVGWESALPTYTEASPALATRKNSQQCLAGLAPKLPELIGGSADLAPSNYTIYNSDLKDFSRTCYEGKNFRFGVREHAMAAVCNGLAAYGGIIPFAATFLNFLGYCNGAVTLSALSRVQVLYIMTHDSIGLGEDGPTHQPIEKIMQCRSTPNLLLFRPADGNETAGCYRAAILNRERPSVLSLSRQNARNLKGSSQEGVLKGAYVIQDCDGTPDVIFVGTGTEVQILVEASASEELKHKKVRVVSMPSWELFEEQDAAYQNSVFPAGPVVVSMEAGSVLGWERYAHASIGMTTFGASAPGGVLYERFGFTASNAVAKAKAGLELYPNGAPHKLVRIA